MTSYQISWEDCEPTIENIWENIKAIDPLFKLDIMGMLVTSYYKYYNYNKTAKDLELEFRAKNLNVGLVAVKWKTQEPYVKLVNEGNGVIIKRNKFNKYFGNKPITKDTIDKIDLSEYVTFISCRPREYVDKEILTHSSSLEENLDKLEIAGDLINLTQDFEKMHEDDITIDPNDLNNKIQDGCKLIKIKEINLQDIFEQSLKDNPGAEPVMYAMLGDGSALQVLVKDGKIVCPIGMNIYFHGSEQCIRFIPINNIKYRQPR